MFSNIVESHIPIYNPNANPRRHYRIDCMWCSEIVGKPDDEGHMHLFTDTWIGQCMRCRSRKYVKQILNAYGIEAPTLSIDVPDLKRLIKGQMDVKVALKNPPEISLPNGSYSIKSVPKSLARVHSTLKEWGIDLDTATSMGWCFNVSLDAFVFPCYFEGKIVYYQTRSLDRYRSGAEGDFSNYGILYNWDCELKDSSSEVYLVEGPKDAAMMYQNGLWAVSLLGHTLSPSQLERLEGLPHSKIICLDNDVTRVAMKMERDHGWTATYLADGDPGDYKDRLSEAVKQHSNLSSKVAQLLKNKQAK